MTERTSVHIHPSLAALQEFVETLEAMRLTYAGNVVMLKELCERVETIEAELDKKANP